MGKQPADRGLLGAVHYRAGRFEEAVQHLEKTAQELKKGKFIRAGFFLAMAQHRLGRTEEARRWLDRAVRDLEAFTQERSQKGWEGDDISIQKECELLRREAEATLKIKLPPKK